MHRFLPSCAIHSALCVVVAVAAGCGDSGHEAAQGASAGPVAAADPTGADPGLVASPEGSDEGQTVRERDACVAALAEDLPQALDDLLEDLGYRDALADACAAQRAVSEGDEAACDGLTATALRAGCRRRLAVRHGRPDACPALLDRGREPVCLAWAARAPARCAAAVGTQALVCRAPFEANAALCRELGVEQAPCEAAVARVGPQLQPLEPRALPHVSGELVARFVAEGARPSPDTAAPLAQPMELDLSHGVYVSRDACVATLQLAPLRRALSHRQLVQFTSFLVRLGDLRESIDERVVDAEALRVGVLPVVGAPGASVRASDRDRPAAESGAPQVSGEVRVVALQPRRGGEVAVVVDVQVPAEGGAYHLTGELHTYVRDIDPLGECQPDPSLL